jgi:hypothetical protein
MYKFNDLFQKKGITAEYKGQTISLYDHLSFQKGEVLKLKILSTHSPYKQAICITIIEPKNSKGLETNNVKARGFNLWEDSIPIDGVRIEILEDVKISIWNVWEEVEANGRKQIWSAKKNAAMKIEVKENKRIYYCNDGDNDEDFDDLVFQLESHESKGNK